MDVDEGMAPYPWRRHKGIKAIGAFDIVIATFSIFYNGKTLLALLGGLNIIIGQLDNWLLVFVILFFTFGIQIVQIIFAMLLITASRKTSCTFAQSIRITRIWSISSATFLILIIIELCIGLATFEYNNYLDLFVAFGIMKIFWRLFTIYFVRGFNKDLQQGLANDLSAQDNPNFLVPVFKMIVTSPENRDLDVTDNEAQQEEEELEQSSSSIGEPLP